MEVQLKPRETVWRGRGKPPTVIPEKVFELLRATYKTGKVGTLPLDAAGEPEPEAAEVLSLLRIGAGRLGKRLREQRGECLAFEMVDKRKRAGGAR
jgi:hypothetical protein